MIKHLTILFILTLLFSGCELQNMFGPSQNETELKKSEIQSKKEIELAKIQSDIKKSELEIQKEQIASNTNTQNKEYEVYKLIIISITIIITIILVGIFVYLNNRRKDKLKSYDDNLEKYFRQKELDAKIQIANKVIEAVSKGNLTKEQEVTLLGTITKNDQLEKKD